uniref:hypothetical protein n=1 Tax=Klebsiella pneumoniae TaxID=573 RepID=UPI00195436F3
PVGDCLVTYSRLCWCTSFCTSCVTVAAITLSLVPLPTSNMCSTTSTFTTLLPILGPWPDPG